MRSGSNQERQQSYVAFTRLVDVSSHYEYNRINVATQPGHEFLFTLGDTHNMVLGNGWWSKHHVHVSLICERLPQTKIKCKARDTFWEKFGKPKGSTLAMTMSLLPTAKIITSKLNLEAAPPLQLGSRWAWPTSLRRAVQDISVLDELCKLVWAMGARTVDCVAIRPALSRFAIVAVPL